MTPHARAKQAAKALDLYEQALNLATELRRDRGEVAPNSAFVYDHIYTGQQGFRMLRQWMDSEELIAKEQAT